MLQKLKDWYRFEVAPRLAAARHLVACAAFVIFTGWIVSYVVATNLFFWFDIPVNMLIFPYGFSHYFTVGVWSILFYAWFKGEI